MGSRLGGGKIPRRARDNPSRPRRARQRTRPIAGPDVARLDLTAPWYGLVRVRSVAQGAGGTERGGARETRLQRRRARAHRRADEGGTIMNAIRRTLNLALLALPLLSLFGCPKQEKAQPAESASGEPARAPKILKLAFVTNNP